MSFHHFRQLLGFFREASRYAELEEVAVSLVGEDGPGHSSYHRGIVACAAVLGVVGAGLGIAMLAYDGEIPERDRNKLLIAPLMFAAIGVVFGTALACLFAPRAFLEGPVGRKWLDLIGTDSIATARIVCLLFTLLLAAVVGFFGWMAWTIPHQPSR